MIAKQHRFHGYSSLGFVYRHGSTVRNPHMLLRYVRNQRRTDYRVAVIVSRKVHKEAVLRNRVRRRIYEIIRTGTPITEPYDIVLTIFNEQIVDVSPEQLTHMVHGLLTKAGIYHKPSHKPALPPRDIVKAREDEL